MDDLVSQYHARPEVRAYDSPVPASSAKRRRSSRGSTLPTEDVAAQSRGIRMGTKKRDAIRAFLGGGTAEGLAILQKHLHTVPYKYCAVNDMILSTPWLYVGTKYKQDLIAEQGNPDVLPPGQPWAEMTCDCELQAKEFDLLLGKLVNTYEDLTSNLIDETKIKFRATLDDVARARQVVLWWTRAGESVLKAACNNDTETFKDLEASVLQNNNLDSEIASILQRRPKIFHAAMLPSFCASTLSSTNLQEAKDLAKASAESAKARLKVFELQLAADEKAIDNHVLGASGLASLLEWKRLHHHRCLAAKGAALVQRYMEKYFQFIVSSGFDQLGGVIAGWKDSIRAAAKSEPLVLVVVDFNVPHTRDMAKITKLTGVISSVLHNAGDQGICLLWAPDLAKQGQPQGGQLPEEEEAVITANFKKHGHTTLSLEFSGGHRISC